MANNGPSYRIAIGEDVPGVRMVIARMLERLGHTVVCTASNGAELVECCRNSQVDVVFTDFDMPVMDGLAAAQELRDQGLPVILISGHPEAEEIVLEHEPVAARVSKPVSLDNLRTALEQAMSRSNAATGP